MPNNADTTINTISDEQYRELVVLQREVAAELEDLQKRAAAIARKTQAILDTAEQKKVLQHILDQT